MCVRVYVYFDTFVRACVFTYLLTVTHLFLSLFVLHHNNPFDQ